MVLLLAAFYAVAISGIPFGYVAVFARLSCKVFLGWLGLWLIAETSAFDAPCAPHKSLADMAMLAWHSGEVGFATTSLGGFLGDDGDCARHLSFSSCLSPLSFMRVVKMQVAIAVCRYRKTAKPNDL